jgi:hypothetical protein
VCKGIVLVGSVLTWEVEAGRGSWLVEMRSGSKVFLDFGKVSKRSRPKMQCRPEVLEVMCQTRYTGK